MAKNLMKLVPELSNRQRGWLISFVHSPYGPAYHPTGNELIKLLLSDAHRALKHLNKYIEEENMYPNVRWQPEFMELKEKLTRYCAETDCGKKPDEAAPKIEPNTDQYDWYGKDLQ